MAKQEKLWVPVNGSLAVIYHTGASGIVLRNEGPKDNRFFAVKLVDDLYPHGFDGKTKPFAEKGQTVDIEYDPNFHHRESVTLYAPDGTQEMLSFGKANKKRDKWLLVRHPNDRAPKTDRFKFTDHIGWDQGKHAGFEPEFRGGHNYPSSTGQPCVSVKYGGYRKLENMLSDKKEISDQIGKMPTARWKAWLKWLEENREKLSDSAWGCAIEDACQDLEHLFENSGLEYASGGRSGGYVVLTNVCDEDTWNLKALTPEEDALLDSYYERNDLKDEEIQKMRELDERRDNAMCDGDKEVVRSLLHMLKETHDAEVNYQLVSYYARGFEESEEEQEANVKTQREVASVKEGVELLEWFASFALEHPDWTDEQFAKANGESEHHWLEGVKKWFRERVKRERAELIKKE